MRVTIRKAVAYAAIFILCGLLVFLAGQYWDLRQPGAVALLYHRVAATSGDKYTMSVKQFEGEMDLLARQGYETVLPRDLLSRGRGGGPQKEVILTFDDGTADHFDVVYPILRRHGYKAVFFVVAKYIDFPGSLTRKQIEEMSEGGMEIGSHSYSHPFLDELPYQQVREELAKSKEDLEAISGSDVVSFAPPGGWWNASVLRAAKDVGYRTFFGCEIGTNNLANPPYVFKRIEVLGGIPLDGFQHLLDPPQILLYKSQQSLKFFLHDIIGSNNYSKLAHSSR
jgi:peptidoglycan/xylan/chitin deacetylase (PgdA/CDA1 family)